MSVYTYIYMFVYVCTYVCVYVCIYVCVCPLTKIYIILGRLRSQIIFTSSFITASYKYVVVIQDPGTIFYFQLSKSVLESLKHRC